MYVYVNPISCLRLDIRFLFIAVYSCESMCMCPLKTHMYVDIQFLMVI